MKNIVRQDPVQACGKAVRKVRIEAAEEFGDDENFYQYLVVENLIGKNAENIQIVNPTQTSSRLIKVLSVVSVK